MTKLMMAIVAMTAFCAGPVSTSYRIAADGWSFMSVAEAGNGNGAGNGNAGGMGIGYSGIKKGEGANAGTPDRGNGKDKPRNARSNETEKGSRDVQSDAEANDTPDTELIKQAKEKSLHAVLSRINSIGRDIRALMTSKDPHMSEIRSFIINSAELAKAQITADAADATYRLALADYENAGLSGDPAETLAALTTVLASADADNQSDIYADIDLAEHLVTAKTQLIAAEARVAQFSVLASDAELAKALASMSNEDLSSADISAATLDWAKAILGVGDSIGAIDALIAQTL